MRIFEIMSEKPRTVPPTLPAADAWRVMVAENVHHLIVKDGSKVVGVLSDTTPAAAMAPWSDRERLSPT